MLIDKEDIKNSRRLNVAYRAFMPYLRQPLCTHLIETSWKNNFVGLINLRAYFFKIPEMNLQKFLAEKQEFKYMYQHATQVTEVNVGSTR